MSVDDPLRIKLIETLLVSSHAAISPNEAALAVQRRADSVETGTRVRLAAIAVLLVNVLWALTRTTRANLW